ncbi:NACHT domain-containing protein [Photobacterium profundum]|uniref:NACHT domain-containing protein n=1 Tax=Photobacterium profundum TaxID=74109 RepID=UPI003D0CD913
MDKYLKALENYYSSEQRPYIELDSAKQIYQSIFNKGLKNSELKMVITGSPGSGKTTMLDQLALELTRSKSGIPIFISLSNYSSSLERLIDRSIGRFDADLSFNTLKNEKKQPIWFLFDGLDEVPSSLYKQFIGELKELVINNNHQHIVFTSRKQFELDDVFSRWDITNINPLSSKEIMDYIGERVDKKEIKSLLSSPHFFPVLSSPLMLSSIIKAVDKGKVKDNYLQTQIASYMGWRGQTKSFLSSGIDKNTLNNTLEALAIDSVLNELVWLETDYVKSIICREFGHKTDVVYDAVINMDPIQVDENRIRFRHKSYQTAYCARYLIKKLSNIESFLISTDTVFSKSNGKLVIEDMFLEANNGQRRIILSKASRHVIKHLNNSLPNIVNSVVLEDSDANQMNDSILSLVKTAASALDRNDKRRRDIIVFALHGFNTRGEWKNTLAAILGQETDGEKYIFHPWDYGDFKISILNPFSRRKKVKEFQSFYNQTLDMYPIKPEVCVIAHSFGTFILGNSIKRFPELNFDRVILLGSVLKSDFPWVKLKSRVNKVLNLVGGSDTALIIAKWIPGLGSAGRDGFLEQPTFLHEHKEEYSDHSDLFGSNYIKSKWIPFIRNGVLPQNK